MAVQLPRLVNQRDGSACQWDNCGPSTGAMALDFATRGASRTTGGAVRKLLPYPLPTACGGTYIRNVADAIRRGWPSAAYEVREDVIGSTKVSAVLAEDKGLHIGVSYAMVRKLAPELLGSATFRGNHFWLLVGDWYIGDALWDSRLLSDGRRAPSPVFRKVQPSIVLRCAAAFLVNGVPLGTGKAYAGITKRQPAPAPVPPPGGEEPLDPSRFRPVALCAVRSGGTLYGDPDRKTVIGATWGGGPSIQLYGLPVRATGPDGRPELVPIRYDRASGSAEDMTIAYVGADLVSNIRLL